MAITKSAKIEAEIEKVKAKIAEQQARLKELEQKKLEAENSEIVDIVRGMSISLTELPLLFDLLMDGGTLGHSVPRLKWPERRLIHALCECTQRPIKSKNQNGPKPYQAPAHLFQPGRSCGPAGLFPDEGRHRQFRVGAFDDRPDDALFLLRHV